MKIFRKCEASLGEYGKEMNEAKFKVQVDRAL